MNLRLITIALISLFQMGFADIPLDSNIQLSYMAIDAKGNFYVADKKNTLYKFDKLGKEITRVNTKLYGSVYSIDCSNPFELYVFYKDQNKVVFFDNMLNIRGELDLSPFGYGSISAVARTFDNQLWLFNATDFELMKVSKSGEVLSSSGLLTNFVSQLVSPYAIIEYDNQVFLADSTAGILVFDMFATYSKTIAIYGSTAFDVNGNRLLLRLKDKLIIYHMKSFQMQSLELAETINIKGLQFKPNGFAYGLENRIVELSGS